MPPEKALGCKRGLIVPRRVQHHLDDAFHIAICGGQGADVYAKPSREG